MQEIINRIEEYMEHEEEDRAIAMAYAKGIIEAIAEIDSEKTYTAREICRLLEVLQGYRVRR